MVEFTHPLFLLMFIPLLLGAPVVIALLLRVISRFETKGNISRYHAELSNIKFPTKAARLRQGLGMMFTVSLLILGGSGPVRIEIQKDGQCFPNQKMVFVTDISPSSLVMYLKHNGTLSRTSEIIRNDLRDTIRSIGGIDVALVFARTTGLDIGDYVHLPCLLNGVSEKARAAGGERELLAFLAAARLEEYSQAQGTDVLSHLHYTFASFVDADTIVFIIDGGKEKFFEPKKWEMEHELELFTALKKRPKIVVVGFGPRDFSFIPVSRDGKQDMIRDAFGNAILVRINEELLRLIAERTGGTYYYYDHPGKIGEVIGKVMRKESGGEDAEMRNTSPLMGYLLILAFVSFLLTFDGFRSFIRRNGKKHRSS